MPDRFISTDAPMTAHDYRVAAARYRLRAEAATRFPCIRDEWLSLAADCDAIALEKETALALA